MSAAMMDSLANYFDHDAYALFNWGNTMGANGHEFRRI